MTGLVFESKRIGFFRVSEKLVRDYLVMMNDEENVGRFIRNCAGQFTEENEIGWVRSKLEENAPVFSMIEKETGDFVGNIEFMDIENGVGELGIAITADKQDRGYGSETIPVFLEYGIREFGLTRVILKTRPYNFRAIRVYGKCGFREYDRTERDVFMEYFPEEL